MKTLLNSNKKFQYMANIQYKDEMNHETAENGDYKKNSGCHMLPKMPGLSSGDLFPITPSLR